MVKKLKEQLSLNNLIYNKKYTYTMSVMKFNQFVNEAEQTPEMEATTENLDVVKKQIEQYKSVSPRLKSLLNMEPEKAQEEFKKIAEDNSLLALEWEVLKMEYNIQKAQEMIKENTTKVADMIKEKDAKLKEMTDKLNSLK